MYAFSLNMHTCPLPECRQAKYNYQYRSKGITLISCVDLSCNNSKNELLSKNKVENLQEAITNNLAPSKS